MADVVLLRQIGEEAKGHIDAILNNDVFINTLQDGALITSANTHIQTLITKINGIFVKVEELL